ncbi:OmpA family protein [Geminicoccus flavidas]|uniref:OmpA family protein n=1 Tax=Geminicoccus flavidas TaxID=2506407 RepID=UPI001F1BAA34|nr:OmpA family protein [Geminicoccus flavidas]
MRILALGAIATTIALTGCASGPDGPAQPGGKTATGAVAGAVVGGVLGNILGHKGVKGEGTAIGAAIGAVVGGGIGYMFDSQEQQFRKELARETQSRQIEIQRVRQDALKLVMPSEVMFPFDSAVLQPGYQTTLRKIADVLNGYPESTATITGYTDSTGSESYNLDLSKRRAEAVRTALINDSVAAGRLTAQGRGKADPIGDNATAAGRQMNRRVEILVQGG